MATAASVVALDQQVVIDAFMPADAVRPPEAIFLEPRGRIQRSLFDHYTNAGIIKPEGARWYLDIPVYNAVKRKQRHKAVAITGLLTATAAVAVVL